MMSSCKKGSIDMDKPIYAQIVLENKESINLELFHDKAPLTVENFVKLASEGYYQNTIFHRIIKDFMIQTGGYKITNNILEELPQTEAIYGEFKANGWDKNDITHEVGVISMARTNVMNSATSQFFLCSAKCDYLDGQYAAFGKVTDSKSIDVILEISKVQTYTPHYAFQNFPVEPIAIKNIFISNEKFK